MKTKKQLSELYTTKTVENDIVQVFDSSGNIILQMYPMIGYAERMDYDENNKCIFYIDSEGDWSKTEYDSSGNRKYHETDDIWIKREFDDNNIETRYEDSNGLLKEFGNAI